MNKTEITVKEQNESTIRGTSKKSILDETRKKNLKRIDLEYFIKNCTTIAHQTAYSLISKITMNRDSLNFVEASHYFDKCVNFSYRRYNKKCGLYAKEDCILNSTINCESKTEEEEDNYPKRKKNKKTKKMAEEYPSRFQPGRETKVSRLVIFLTCH